MLKYRAMKSWAAVVMVFVAVIELPFAILWALGPGLIWRDNPVSFGLGSFTGWFYDKYVKGDRAGFPNG